MSLTLTPLSLESLAGARDAHFRRLGEGPELYLELLLQSALAHEVRWHGQPAGYCVATEDGLLAELELERHVWPEKSELFAALLGRLEVRGARCFSFDSLLLGLCVERGWVAALEGPLFRDLLDERGPAAEVGLRLRPAALSDIDSILPHREGVFDTDEQCREWVARGHVSVLEREGEAEGQGVFVGVGLLTRVWPARPEHDVGVMVHPDFRGRGYAAYILRSLKRRCLHERMRPTAGCAADNVASARALHRAGFASQHSLILFRRGD